MFSNLWAHKFSVLGRAVLFWPGCIALCFLFLSLPLLPQEYVWKAYRQPDGLGNLSVLAIAQDREGFLWSGTENGLYRFSGTDFLRFGSQSGVEGAIHSLHLAPSGALWIGTSENLYRWTGSKILPATDSREKYPISSGSALASLDGNQVLAVVQNRVLLFESRDLGQTWSERPFFSDRQLALWPKLKGVESIYVSPHADIWMNCSGFICRLSSGRLTVWKTEQGVAFEHWMSFVEGRDGSIWAQGEDRILQLPAGESRFVDRSIRRSPQPLRYAHMPLACDGQGRILASSASGLLRWDGREWQTIDKANGLDSGHVPDIFFDSSGELWLGSAGRGLYHWLGYRDWENWTSTQGLPTDLI
jgi:ligand-binding sensor domain-containing protein